VFSDKIYTAQRSEYTSELSIDPLSEDQPFYRVKVKVQILGTNPVAEKVALFDNLAETSAEFNASNVKGKTIKFKVSSYESKTNG
jgi:hypothetical protein